MPLPWVSRGRFEDLERRCEQLEAERRNLLDRVLELSAQKPLYAPPVSTKVDNSEQETTTKVDKDEESPAPAPGRITIAAVRSLADRAALTAAKTRSSIWDPKVTPKVANGN